MNLYAKALDLLAQNRRFALATVVHATGSTPQKAGANALFEAAGPIHGTLGGGCLEAECRKRALDALDQDLPLLFDLKLEDVDGWDDGLVCGGKVRIFVQPGIARNVSALNALHVARITKLRGALITTLRGNNGNTGAASFLLENEFDTIPCAAALHAAVEKDCPAIITVNGEERFIEPVLPPPRLLIAGAGHIGKATAKVAAFAGFEVTVIDDRPTFASLTNLPDATNVICADIAVALATQQIDPNTYIVIVTRGHRHDVQALAACIASPARYIGLIGSRRKSLLLRQRLINDSLATEAQAARVISPIGLDIGSQTIEEIAISITAQLIQIRRS